MTMFSTQWRLQMSFQRWLVFIRNILTTRKVQCNLYPRFQLFTTFDIKWTHNAMGGQPIPKFYKCDREIHRVRVRCRMHIYKQQLSINGCMRTSYLLDYMPPKMLRRRHTRGWCDQSWSMLALFGTQME